MDKIGFLNDLFLFTQLDQVVPRKKYFFSNLHRVQLSTLLLKKNFKFTGYQPLTQRNSEKSIIELKHCLDFEKEKNHQYCSLVLDNSCAEQYGEKELLRMNLLENTKYKLHPLRTKCISPKQATAHNRHKHSSFCLVKLDASCSAPLDLSV